MYKRQNLELQFGWQVEKISTNKEEGSIDEFIEKEGKWFNYIKGNAGSGYNVNNSEVTSGFDNADSSFQGLGTLDVDPQVVNNFGCTDDELILHTNGLYYYASYNYDPSYEVEDGSCVAAVLGCMDSSADGGGNFANITSTNTDDGSCIYFGCTTISSTNYDANATQNDGSCIPFVYGCMTVGQFNYNAANNVAQVSATDLSDPCVAITTGCINDPNATNFAGINNLNGVNPPANTDDGSCAYVYSGCTDPNACTYLDPAGLFGSTVIVNDDGSCLLCGDSTADNYDAATCDDSCLYCVISDVFLINNVDANLVGDNEIQLFWLATDVDDSGNNSAYDATAAAVINYTITYVNDNTGVSYSVTAASNGYHHQLHNISNLTPQTPYTITIQANCANSSSVNIQTINFTTAPTPIYGCTDPAAYNENTLANTEDGSCVYEGCTDATSLNGITQFLHPNSNSMYAYNPINATIDDGSCVAVILGCTDDTMFNYNVLANSDDGSCVPFVFGCTDPTMNNAGTSKAATNYNSAANSDDGTCNYIMPEQWTAAHPWGSSHDQLLNAPGWKSSGNWGNPDPFYRKLYAIWDVSLSPKIAMQFEFAYENSASSNSFPNPGDITNFLTNTQINNTWYSNNNGDNWNSINGWTVGDPIQLIRFSANDSGSVSYIPPKGNPQNYPPNNGLIPGVDGLQQQAAKFSFTNSAVHSQHTTNIAEYYVTLGCNDSGIDPFTGNVWGNYNGEISFFDNSLCSSVVVGDVWGGYNLSFQHTLATEITAPFTYYVNDHEITIGYNTSNTNPYVNSSPVGYIVQVSIVLGDGIADPFDFSSLSVNTTNPSAPEQSATLVLPGVTTQNNFSITVPLTQTNFSPTSIDPLNQWMYYRVRPIISWNGTDYNTAVYGTDMEFWNQSLTIPSLVGTLAYPNNDQSTPTL